MNSPRLRSMLRDPRVTCRRAAQLLASRVPAFVAAILARHTRGVIAVFGPERASRRPHAIAFAGATHHHHHHDRRTNLAVRVEIGLVPSMRTRAGSAPFQPWTAPFQPGRAAASGERTPERQGTAPPAVTRIVARERRVETSLTMREVLRDAIARRPGGDAMAEMAMVPRPRAQPVEMVVRRPRTAPLEAERSAAMEPQRAETSERQMRPSLVRPNPIHVQAPLGAAELGRVTDHVLRAIDRRILAQRERRGRA